MTIKTILKHFDWLYEQAEKRLPSKQYERKLSAAKKAREDLLFRVRAEKRLNEYLGSSKLQKEFVYDWKKFLNKQFGHTPHLEYTGKVSPILKKKK